MNNTLNSDDGSIVRVAVCLTPDGCGSANVHFFSNLQEAEKYEEEDFESSGEGWGEPTARMVTLCFDGDGNLTNGTR